MQKRMDGDATTLFRTSDAGNSPRCLSEPSALTRRMIQPYRKQKYKAKLYKLRCGSSERMLVTIIVKELTVLILKTGL